MQITAHHAIIQLHVNVVFLATMFSAAILWVLWHNTDGLYQTILDKLPKPDL